MTRALAILSLLSITALSACGGDSADSAAPESSGSDDEALSASAGAADSSAATGSASARRGPRVRLRDSQFGPVLFDGRDRALYLFTRDGARSRCYGECAEAWPPFFARGRPRAGRGVDAEMLGTVRRRDGRRQVTYGGQPLYFYVHDPRRQVLCNDVVEFRGTWYALTAAGEPPA